MALLASLLALLGAAPRLSLAPDSSCQSELRAVGVPLLGAEPAAAELSLSGAKNELRVREAGRLVLSRVLGPGTCAEASRAAVVVVARWLTSLAPEGQPPSTPQVKRQVPQKQRLDRSEGDSTPQPPSKSPTALPDPPTPSPTPSPTPAGATSNSPTPMVSPEGGEEPTAKTSPSPLPTESKSVIHWEVLLGGGVVVPQVPQAIAPVVSLDLSLLFNALRLDLGGFYDFGGAMPVVDAEGLGRGTLSTRGGAVLSQAQFCLAAPLRACLGATVGGRILQGDAQGSTIFQQSPKLAGAFVFGPSLQLAWVAHELRVALDLAILVTPQAPVFRVEGFDATLKAPPLQGLLRASIGAGDWR